MWPIVIKYLPRVVMVVVLLGVAYMLGYQHSHQKQQVIIERLQKDYADKLLAAEQQYSAALKEAQEKTAKQQQATHQTGVALAEANARIRKLQQKRQQEISHALEKDHTAADVACFGQYGLQHYLESLGYTN